MTTGLLGEMCKQQLGLLQELGLLGAWKETTIVWFWGMSCLCVCKLGEDM